ncbi:SDR family oxidoreductase [Peribacillus saganii]|uniref:SDR family oxidoreductase n=1 Tax=Peribacillus saganii TaxID=2303992 RepID=A0A372LBH6_9BACI|nr:SDR family oxidoreductase [Peribacillus saganii]RFU62810.1 SDR family oxidoreductase [Peribacillus saganii]
MELNLKGKVALVIASSQGLGKAIAIQLAKEGAHIMLTSRNEDKLRTVKEKIAGIGEGLVSYCPCDITKPEEIQRLIKQTNDDLGKVDILINNAGGPPGGTFDKFNDEDWQKAFELNLLSYVRIIRAALPDLKKEGGRIINIASSSIKAPIPGLILSNTFRTGIVGLAKSLAEELAPHNILINTVAPGRIATDRTAYLDQTKADNQGLSLEQVEEASKKMIPLGRYGSPEEFAKVVTFLASDASSFVTGISLLVDGGMVKAI